jgi:hypothetical protein
MKNTPEDWEKVYNIHRLAINAGVSWSMFYHESDDTWSFRVTSASLIECLDMRHRSFELSTAIITEHLEKL